MNGVPTIGETFRAAFSASAEELLRLDEALRSGDSADALHDARVSIRRLRSHLRSFRSILVDDWARPLRAELDWLNECLSPPRDADVLVETLERRAEALPATERGRAAALLDRLRSTRGTYHATLRTALCDARYAALVEDLVEAARHPCLNPHAGESARKAGRAILGRVWEKTRACARGVGRLPSDADLHEIRVKSKHVRYAGEAIAPVSGKRVRRLARRAQELQTVLGEQHDAVLAVSHLQPFLDDRELAFAAVELARRSQEAADDGRRRWSRAWRRLRAAYRRL